MAVIREKRQYISQPIGVVKANISNNTVTETLSNVADSFIEGSFKELMKEANKAGSDAGVSVTSEQLRTINPETGQPEAFEIPPQFGKEASRAYQATVERRYVSEVEEELKLESARIYLETYQKPNGFGEYSRRMREIAGSITESALPRFQSIVSGISSSLVASTEINFLQNDVKLKAADDLIALQNMSDNDATNLTNTGAVIDFNSVDQANQYFSTVEGNLIAQYDGLIAKVHDGSTHSQAENKIVQSVGVGIARNIGAVYEKSLSTPNPLTPADLQTLQMIIQTGVGAENIDKRLKPFIRIADKFKFKIGKDDKDFSELINNSLFSELNSIHDRAVRIKNSQDALQTKEQQDAQYDYLAELIDSTSKTGFNGLAQATRAVIASGDFQAGINKFNSDIDAIRKKGNSLKFSSEKIENGIMSYRKSVSDALLSIVFGRPVETVNNKGEKVMRPLLPSEANAVERYLDGKALGTTLEDLPKEIRPIITELEKFQTIRTNDDFRRAVEEQNQELQGYFSNQIKSANEISLGQQVFNGGSLSNQETRGVVDKLTIGENAKTPLFFLTDEGFATFDQVSSNIVKAGFVGQNLVDTFKIVSQGRQDLTDTQIERAFEIWFLLESRPDQTGGTFNVWRNSELGGDTLKTMTAMGKAIKGLRGTKNSAQVYRDMREMLAPQNEEMFGDQMTYALGGKKVDSYLSDLVGESNFEARNYFEGLLPYFVATGMSPDNIESTIVDMMDEHFLDTEGYVINNGSGEIFKSAFSLSRFMDKRTRINSIANLNKFLDQIGANARVPRQEATFAENIAIGGPLQVLLGTTATDLEIYDRSRLGYGDGRSYAETIEDMGTPVHLMPIAGESIGSGEDIIYQLVHVVDGRVEPYPHPKTNKFIHINLRDLKASAVPKVDNTDDNWLMMEYRRQQQMAQGTTKTILQSDMSTIPLNDDDDSSFGFTEFVQQEFPTTISQAFE